MSAKLRLEQRFKHILKPSSSSNSSAEPSIYPFNKIDIKRPQQASTIDIKKHERQSRHTIAEASTVKSHITASAPLWRHRLQNQNPASREDKEDPLAPHSDDINVKSISTALAATSKVRTCLALRNSIFETSTLPCFEGRLPPRLRPGEPAAKSPLPARQERLHRDAD